MFTSRACVLLLAGLTPVLASPLLRRAEEGGKVVFGYEGNNGPNLWPGLCQDLQSGQSPIDIRPGSSDANAGALVASLQPVTGAKLVDTGHGLDFELPEGGQESTFVAAGQSETFKVKGVHIHTPSEHRFNGSYFDAEMHIVGESPSGITSVMAVMYEVSDQPMPNNLLSIVEQQLPLSAESVDLPPFDFSSIMAATNNLSGFHTYIGSLTTPPCTGNVMWNVLDKPVPISVKEILALRKAQGFSARFTQVARDEEPVFTPPKKSEAPSGAGAGVAAEAGAPAAAEAGAPAAAEAGAPAAAEAPAVAGVAVTADTAASAGVAATVDSAV